MTLRLSCADFTFPMLSHDHALDLISMLGLEAVDVGLFEGRTHLYPSREFADRGAARELRQRASDRGLVVSDVFLQVDSDFVGCAINHPGSDRRAKARDWFRHALDYACGCECAHVTVLPGVQFEGEAERDSLARCHEELAWRVEKAKAAGIEFGVEAHVGSIAPHPRQALALVAAVPGLTLTLDYTHFTRNGVPDSEIEPLLAHTSHFHVRGACGGRLQCAFKENTIDYRRVASVLRGNGYTGFMALEYVWTEWERCNEVDNLSETILFHTFLRSL